MRNFLFGYEFKDGRQSHSQGEGPCLDGAQDNKNGIWPRSVILWMAAFYMSLLIIRPWEELFPALGTIHFERIYAMCMITGVLLSKKKSFRMSFQAFTVLMFLAMVGVSCLFSFDKALAWDAFYVYITNVIFFFVLLLVIRNPYDLLFIVISYLVIMAVYLAKSQWEFFVNGAARYTMGVVRMWGIESTFGGPNSLAMSIVVSLPMWFFLWNVRKELIAGWPKFWRKWFPRFLTFYIVLAVTSIALTNSRSGMLSFVFFVALITLRGKGIGRKLRYIALGAIFLALLWQILPAEKQGRFRTIWNPGAGPENAQASAEGRIEGFKAGMIMFERFPITGVGIGNFIPYRVRSVDGIPFEAHNLVGQALGETGILGGLTFLLVFGTIFVNSRRVRNIAGRYPNKTIVILSGLALACRNALILLLFEGLFAHNLVRFNWLWLGAFCALAARYAERSLLMSKIMNRTTR